MAWYDVFASFYDSTVERVYRPYRSEAVAAMGLKQGQCVLDLACGTGPNLEHLVSAVGPSGSVFAVDLSEGMLARASRRVERANWNRVYCLQRDARKLALDDLSAARGEQVQLDAMLTTLGLSVIPDWQDVLAATWSMLPQGGRYVIFDIYAERWVPTSSLVTRVAQADLKRQPWRFLEQLGARVEHRVLPGSPHLHGGRPYLAVGTKTA